MKVVATANLFLLMVAILAVLVYVIPEPETCFVPPHAPERGIYESCWTFWELWT